MSVKISRERYSSEYYKNTPKENCNLCKPVIIDIQKTFFGPVSHERPSASRDRELLKETFRELGFAEPHLISDQNSKTETDPLYSVKNLWEELRSIGNDNFTYPIVLFIPVYFLVEKAQIILRYEFFFSSKTVNEFCLTVHYNYGFFFKNR
jgi:hypothetical protein